MDRVKSYDTATDFVDTLFNLKIAVDPGGTGNEVFNWEYVAAVWRVKNEMEILDER